MVYCVVSICCGFSPRLSPLSPRFRFASLFGWFLLFVYSSPFLVGPVSLARTYWAWAYLYVHWSASGDLDPSGSHLKSWLPWNSVSNGALFVRWSVWSSCSPLSWGCDKKPSLWVNTAEPSYVLSPLSESLPLDFPLKTWRHQNWTFVSHSVEVELRFETSVRNQKARWTIARLTGAADDPVIVSYWTNACNVRLRSTAFLWQHVRVIFHRYQRGLGKLYFARVSQPSEWLVWGHLRSWRKVNGKGLSCCCSAK